MDDGEDINRRAGSARKTVVDRDSLRDAIRGTASLTGQLVRCHSRNNSLSTTVYTSVDIFASVNALLDSVDGCAKPTRFATSVTLCPAGRGCGNFHSVSFRSHFEIHNINTPFPLMSQPQSIGWLNNQIITAKQP